MTVDLRNGSGESQVLRLYSIAKTRIERPIKVRGEAKPLRPGLHRIF